MHTVTTKSACCIFHVVQVSTKAKHSGLLLKTPETGSAESFPQPPNHVHDSHSGHQDEVFSGVGCEGDIFCTTRSGHLHDWASFILLILLVGLFVCSRQRDHTYSCSKLLPRVEEP